MKQRTGRLKQKPRTSTGKWLKYVDRDKELAHLIKIQACEMKNENLSRLCGD